MSMLERQLEANVLTTTLDAVTNLPLAHELRAGLLRHRDDGDGVVTLRYRSLRRACSAHRPGRLTS